MAVIPLTDLGIQKLKWNGKTTVYFDERLPGFGIRVGKHRKVFIVMQGAERKVTSIGRYPAMTLKEASRAARIALSAPPDAPGSKTYKDAVDAFLEAKRGLKKATLDQYQSYLELFTFDKLSEITKDGITEKLKIWDGKPFAQNYAYATIRGFLNYCSDQQWLIRHPLMRGKAPNKTKSRARVLSDEELGRVWRCTPQDTYGSIVRLLILTAQRRIEVRNLTPEDVADDVLTFHTKGDGINLLPVTPLIEKELTLPFHFNNWSDSKARLDAECSVSFQHRDLRRTAATKMAKLGVDPYIIDRILGHIQDDEKSDRRTDIKHIYNRYHYLPQIKEALLRYHAHVLYCASLGNNHGRLASRSLSGEIQDDQVTVQAPGS